MTRRRLSLRADDRGTTVLEVALIAPVMLTMLLGFFELGHQMYTTAILRGAVEAAGRSSSLADGPLNSTTIDAAVTNQVKSVANHARLRFDRRFYSDYTHVAKPERYTDTNSNGRWDSGECLEDVNGNNSWDADPSRSGSGGAEDVIFYTVEVEYERLIPIGGLIGIGNDVTIKAGTLLKNQPFAEHQKPTVATCS